MMMALLMMLLTSCSAEAQTRGRQNEKADAVKVMYFHGKQRCVTCKAVGKLARELVAQDYATQAAQGKVQFVEVDFSTPDGERIADRYEVSSSALVLVKGSQADNVTAFAFQHARSNPESFKRGMKAKIDKMLK